MSTLNYIGVNGLLGRFDHTVDFDADDSFVILHGPNGVGKTHLLELVQSVLSGKLWELANIRFESVVLGFTGDLRLQIWRESEPTVRDRNSRRIRVKPPGTSILGGRPMVMKLTKGNKLQAEWRSDETSRDDSIEAMARRYLEGVSGLDRFGPDKWYDMQFDRPMTTLEAVTRYSASSADSTDMWQSILHMPDEISSLIKNNPVKFVQTQRLLLANELVSRGSHSEVHRRESTVVEFSRDISRIISDKLAENSKISSQLDRTYPRRVLERPDDPNVSTAALLTRYAEQTDLRNRLAEVSLLDRASDDIPLSDDRELNATERRVLEVYLDDADDKLGTFRDTLEKITLLRNIVNSRFLYKTLYIDAEQGFVFETDARERISPDKLSSGEQHELVLLYELLFRTSPKSIVLIDEPEISLHVKWQREFINDLVSVSKLSDLRFVVATHSPQVVDRWHSKAVLLAPGEEWQ